MGFEDGGHVDPSFHPKSVRPSQRIDEEHEQKAGIDADVIVTNGSNGINVLSRFSYVFDSVVCF